LGWVDVVCRDAGRGGGGRDVAGSVGGGGGAAVGAGGQGGGGDAVVAPGGRGCALGYTVHQDRHCAACLRRPRERRRRVAGYVVAVGDAQVRGRRHVR